MIMRYNPAPAGSALMGMFGDQFGRFEGKGQKVASEKSWLISVFGLAVSLLSLILAQFQKQQARYWAVITVGALTALVGLYRPVGNFIRNLIRRAHNFRVVRKHKKELCRLARQAGIFLDSGSSRNDVLAGIVQDLSQQHSQLLLGTRIPNPGIFYDHWLYLYARIQSNHLSANEFHDSADELLSLLRSYTTFSVLPLFHTFASEYRAALTDNQRSKLNAFQQQFVSFLVSYAGFLNRLNDEFQGLRDFHPEMAKPQPL